MIESILVDRNGVRTSGESVRYLALSLEAPEALARSERRPVNLALVLDRSGSMEGSKLTNAREAARQVLRVLRPQDRISVVIYDDEVQVLTPSSMATPSLRAQAERAIEGVQARNSTNLSGGWLKGCEQVAMHLESEEVGRCLLLTDGLANRGITSPAELVEHARALRTRRITTSTFGIGSDFDESLLRRLAEAGGGNFYFIDQAEQIPEFIRSEVDETLEITARDVTLCLRVAPGIQVACFNDFPVREQDGELFFELGSMVSGQLLEPLFELRIPAGDEGSERQVELRITDRDGRMNAGPFSVTLRHERDEAIAAAKGAPEVLRRAAKMRSARAAQQALELNQQGNEQEAKQLLLAEADALTALASDEEIDKEIAELRQKAEEYGSRMDLRSRKMRYFEEHAKLKGRSFDGKALRKGATSTQPPVVSLPGGVLIAGTTPSAKRLLETTLRRLAPVASTIGGLGLQNQLKNTPHASTGYLSPSEEQALIQEAQQWSAALRMVVTEQGFEDNWFSHWKPAERVALVSLSGWSSTASVAPEAFLAYELLLFGLYTRTEQYNHLALLHRETRGCIFDFCELRSEIEIKLQAADLCPNCRGGLRSFGIDPSSLTAYCEAIRSMASPSPHRG